MDLISFTYLYILSKISLKCPNTVLQNLIRSYENHKENLYFPLNQNHGKGHIFQSKGSLRFTGAELGARYDMVVVAFVCLANS